MTNRSLKASRTAAALFIALAAVSAPAQPVPAKPGDAANGKRLFIADGCYQCHGREGQGGSSAPIGSYGPRIAPPALSVEAIRRYLRHPTGGMPPFTDKVLSDAEIDDIYAFLKTIPAPPPVKDIPLLNQ